MVESAVGSVYQVYQFPADKTHFPDPVDLFYKYRVNVSLRAAVVMSGSSVRVCHAWRATRETLLQTTFLCAFCSSGDFGCKTPFGEQYNPPFGMLFSIAAPLSYDSTVYRPNMTIKYPAICDSIPDEIPPGAGC